MALSNANRVKDPEQLVLVTSRGFWYGDTWGDGSVLSYPLFADLRDHNDVFTGMVDEEHEERTRAPCRQERLRS